MACGNIAVPQTECDRDEDCPTAETCRVGQCNRTAKVCEYTTRPDTCYVDGQCYLDGQSKPGEPCLVCSPNETNTALSPLVCEPGLACDMASGQCVVFTPDVPPDGSPPDVMVDAEPPLDLGPDPGDVTLDAPDLTDHPCTPDCAGKACGDDGCDGSCGTCSQGEQCIDHQCACVPDCAGKQCGDDGCGGDCGTCPGGEQCMAGQCEGCSADCAAKECGDDGCGGQCGTCPAGEQCVEGECLCIPDCDGKECGDGGCGGLCGTCGFGYGCDAAGKCVLTATCDNVPMFGCCTADGVAFSCIPFIGQLSVQDCEAAGLKCGFQVFGYECGSQETPGGGFPYLCPGDTCIDVCVGQECGWDCGQDCGTCPDGEYCSSETCQPCSCGTKVCGQDQCGTSCGTCGDGTYCDSGGTCEPCSCGANVCGEDPCGNSCGECPADAECDDGQCVSNLAANGEPCTVAEECAGGYCFASQAGWTCTNTCTTSTDCADGETCWQSGADGPTFCGDECFCGLGQLCGQSLCESSCGECPEGFTCDTEAAGGACFDTLLACELMEGITYEGCCDGDSMVWCAGANAVEQLCGAGGCGWSASKAYYACGGQGEDPSGTHPLACPWN